MQTLFSHRWHHLPLEEVATLMESDGERGLDMFEVSRRQAHFGPNQISLKKGKSPLLLFLQQFHQPLIYILLVAVAVTVVRSGKKATIAVSELVPGDLVLLQSGDKVPADRPEWFRWRQSGQLCCQRACACSND